MFSDMIFYAILNIYVKYSQFHKTLPKSRLQMQWISVKFYEMGDIWTYDISLNIERFL